MCVCVWGGGRTHFTPRIAHVASYCKPALCVCVPSMVTNNMLPTSTWYNIKQGAIMQVKFQALQREYYRSMS